jgi:hypothetical protein
MGHGSPRLDRVRSRFRNRLSEEKSSYRKSLSRRWFGVLAGRCVLYPSHSTPLTRREVTHGSDGFA